MGETDRQAGRELTPGLRIGFAAALAVILGAAIISYRSSVELTETARWVGHTHEVREHLATTLSALQDAETSQRGYVITGRHQFLRQYRAARLALGERLRRLRRLVADNPSQRRNLEELRKITRRRLVALRQGIAARQRGDVELARRIITRGEGTRLMNGARELMGSMQEFEGRLLQERSAAANRAGWIAGGTFTVAALLAIMALVALRHLVRRSLRERTEAAARLEISEARFRRVVESNMIGILFWRDDGTITEANDAFLHLLDYAREDIRDGTLNWRRLLAPETMPAAEVALAELRAHGLCTPYEAEAIRADGSRLPILCAGAALDAPYQGHGVSWVVDISDRRRAEAELRESLDVIETVNRLGQRLTTRLDLEEIVQAVTDAGTQVSGAAFGAFFYNVINERGEAYTLYTISGVPRAAFETFPMPRNTAVFAPTFRGEGVVRLDDVTQDERYGQNPPHNGMPRGHLKVRSYLAVPVVARSGEVIGGLFFGHPEAGVFSERDERVVVGLAAQAAAAIDNARLFESARRARDAAEAANRTKDEFLSVVSHELRTPLTSMTNWVRVLRAGDPQRSVRAMDAIDRAARSQAKLVEDLLDVSRIVTGRLRLDLRPIDLAGVVRAAIDTVAPTADAKGVHIATDLGRDFALVAGDPDRLQQVVWNLLSNAVKFTAPGGRVRVGLTSRDGEVRVVVSDSGEGIDPAFMPSVFERFQQAEPAASRRQGGLGLGLAIVRHLMELHGGTVSAASDGVGHGATFTIALPAVMEPAAIARAN